MVTNQSSENPGGSLNVRDREALGRHRYLGLLKYRDFEAGYCRACAVVYGVTCPNCQAASGSHQHTDAIFNVQHPLETIIQEGFVWTPVECRKCDFRFRVMVQ